MLIVGEKISKVTAERSDLKGQITIKNNTNIEKISKQDLYSAGGKKKGLSIDFSFACLYNDGDGKIEVTGSVFCIGKDAELKKMESGWKKDKKLKEEFNAPIFNKLMELGYMQAIPLASAVGLPAPIRFPRVSGKK
tara:strand:- start:438 stop:845 length:408 start_codon:yes stop_codon:yes gene_type:complete